MNIPESAEQPKTIKLDNDKAVEDLYKRYYKSVLFYAYQYLGNEYAAQDATQNLFVYIFNNKERIVIQGSIDAYLYRGIINQCNNYIKKEKKDKSRDIEYIKTADRTDHLDIEKEHEQFRQIEIFLAQMPADKKEIFRRFFIQKEKANKIGEDMGFSANTVKRYGYEVKNFLKSQLNGKKLLFFCITFCLLLCLNIILWKI